MTVKSITTRKQAEELASQYPWFNAPLRFFANDNNEQLPARILIADKMRPYLRAGITNNNTLLRKPGKTSQNSFTEANLISMPIIDKFIDKGDHRITAKESTPEDILFNTDGIFIPDDNDLLTEELAEVYMAQGLVEQTIEIYRRLSLLNPEKSVYFAKLIEKAESPLLTRINKNN